MKCAHPINVKRFSMYGYGHGQAYARAAKHYKFGKRTLDWYERNQYKIRPYMASAVDAYQIYDNIGPGGITEMSAYRKLQSLRAANRIYQRHTRPTYKAKTWKKKGKKKTRQAQRHFSTGVRKGYKTRGKPRFNKKSSKNRKSKHFN